MSLISRLETISAEEIGRVASASMAGTPSPKVSRKYSFISTMEVVNWMGQHGWEPVQASQIKARKAENEGFQKHLVRLQHRDLIFGENAVQSIITNAHNGMHGYDLMLGIWRSTCANGHIVGRSFGKISIRHQNVTIESVLDASNEMLKSAPSVIDKVNRWSWISLSASDRDSFAEKSSHVIYGEGSEVNPSLLLMARRKEDCWNDLWTVFNVIQENAMRGGIQYPHISKEDDRPDRMMRTRPIRQIARTVQVNQALFDIAEEFEGR